MSTFKRYSKTTTTSADWLNTAPTNAAVIIGLVAANTGTASDSLDVQIGSGGPYLVKAVSIPPNSTLSVLDGKIVLNATERLYIKSTNGDCDVTVSILEL